MLYVSFGNYGIQNKFTNLSTGFVEHLTKLVFPKTLRNVHKLFSKILFSTSAKNIKYITYYKQLESILGFFICTYSFSISTSARNKHSPIAQPTVTNMA